MTEREYVEYIEECNKSIDDFNRIAKKLGVDPTGVPINMAFVLKLLRAIERVLDSQPCEDAVSRQEVINSFKNWLNDNKDPRSFEEVVKEMPSAKSSQKEGVE